MRRNSELQQSKVSDFQGFWDAYGLKRDRIMAERAWRRLSAKDKKAAMAGIPAYREDCLQRGISMMYAQGYLNHRRWEDEMSTQQTQQTHPLPLPGMEGSGQKSPQPIEMEKW
jgi:hypothetical protein